MKKPAVTPRDAAREFREDEMFFSTTDPRGVITAGNEVFARISGYPPDQLVGRPHSLIRHPDMPRAAFRIVWDYLKQSRRTAALVKNLAADGCYYWVVALFAPAPGGYLSIRFKPTGAMLDSIRPVYAAMVAEEERHITAGADVSAAMDASTTLLLAAVRRHGFADYDAFMRALLCEELKSRDAALARLGRSLVRPLADDGDETAAGTASIRRLHAHGLAAYEQLRQLFLRLDEFVGLQKSLEDKATFVDSLTRELRVAAMNAALASARVGNEAKSLGVISHHMGGASADVAHAVGELNASIGNVAERLRSVIFNLAAGRLQIEMTMEYLEELCGHRPEATERESVARSVRALQHAFRHSAERASRALSDLGSSTRDLTPRSRDLSQHVLGLQVAQLSGVVESTRLTDAGDFGAVFSEIRELITRAREQLDGLDDALAQLGSIAADAPAIAVQIAAAAAEMESAASGLGGDAGSAGPGASSDEEEAAIGPALRSGGEGGVGVPAAGQNPSDADVIARA